MSAAADMRVVEAVAEGGARVLTVGAWSLVVDAEGESEPRVRDLDAAERLGFSRPRDIRKLIERIWPENRRPNCRATVARQPVGPGGKGVREFTVNEYWLTEAELLKLIARCETPIAEAILDDMIRVYLAVRRHLVTAELSRALPSSAKALPAPKSTDPALPLNSAEIATIRRAARRAKMPVEDFLSLALTTWAHDLDHHMRFPSLAEKHKGLGKLRPVFTALTEGLHNTVARKAKACMGNTDPSSLAFAAYLLMEMGAHLQDANELAALGATVTLKDVP